MTFRALAGPMLALGLLSSLTACASLAAAPPPPGWAVDIGGRTLRLVCDGPAEARPIVWFEAGAFGQAEDSAVVRQRLAQGGVRACAYDRAGLALSTSGPGPRDGEAILADRNALLTAAGLDGPFVVVGHSMAGLYVRLWAVREPERVVGLVLIDPVNPEALDAPETAAWFPRFGRLARTASAASRLSLLKPLALAVGDTIGLPPREAALKRRSFGDPGHNRGAAVEVASAEAAARQALAAGPLDADLPVEVLLTGPEPRIPNAWRRVEAAPALRSRRGRVTSVPEADHASILGRRHADAVVAAVNRILAAAVLSPKPNA